MEKHRSTVAEIQELWLKEKILKYFKNLNWNSKHWNSIEIIKTLKRI